FRHLLPATRGLLGRRHARLYADAVISGLAFEKPALVATDTPPVNTQRIAGDPFVVAASEHDRCGADMSLRQRRRLFTYHSVYLRLGAGACRHNSPQPQRDDLLRLDIECGDPYRPCRPLLP